MTKKALLNFDSEGRIHGIVFQYHLSNNELKYYAIFHHGVLLGKASFDEKGNLVY